MVPFVTEIKFWYLLPTSICCGLLSKHLAIFYIYDHIFLLQVNLSVNLGKPMIPLLMEKMSWPPVGSMGPIFSEYLFVRFFQRAGEETNDNRIWPLPKFQEMLMQLNCYGMTPEESLITDSKSLMIWMRNSRIIRDHFHTKLDSALQHCTTVT